MSITDRITDRLRVLDHRQQRSRRVSFMAAVVKKFIDDQAGQLAALIAYYGFVSLFPLLLVLVTILGFVLQGDPGEQQRILNGALGQFPIISDQLKLHSLTGSGPGLAIGVIGSLLAGMGITGATQNAFNRIWSVPFKHRPNFIYAHLRGLGMLAILGTMSIISTTAAGFVGTSSHGAAAVDGRSRGRVRVQPRAVHDSVQIAHRGRCRLARTLPRRDRRERLLAAPAEPGRCLRRARAQAHRAAATGSSRSCSGCSPGSTWVPS